MNRTIDNVSYSMNKGTWLVEDMFSKSKR
jgi:hypothetical protein